MRIHINIGARIENTYVGLSIDNSKYHSILLSTKLSQRPPVVRTLCSKLYRLEILIKINKQTKFFTKYHNVAQ